MNASWVLAAFKHDDAKIYLQLEKVPFASDRPIKQQIICSWQVRCSGCRFITSWTWMLCHCPPFEPILSISRHGVHQVNLVHWEHHNYASIYDKGWSRPPIADKVENIARVSVTKRWCINDPKASEKLSKVGLAVMSNIWYLSVQLSESSSNREVTTLIFLAHVLTNERIHNARRLYLCMRFVQTAVDFMLSDWGWESSVCAALGLRMIASPAILSTKKRNLVGCSCTGWILSEGVGVRMDSRYSKVHAVVSHACSRNSIRRTQSGPA